MLPSQPTPNDLSPRRRSLGRAWLALPALVAIFFLVVPYRVWNPHTLYPRWLIHRLGNDSTQAQAFTRLAKATDAGTIGLLIEAMYVDKDPRIQARAQDVLVAIGDRSVDQW